MGEHSKAAAAKWRLRNYTIPPGLPTESIAPGCRHYLGDRPCVENHLCTGCRSYEPYSHRVCVIKLGALGDVIRTLCILPEIRRQYPAAHITWVTLPNGRRMIQDHPQIDRVLAFDPITCMVLAQEAFDTVISLDKEPQPCALAMSLFAKQKLGVGLSDHGTPKPMNPEAEPYFHLGLSDELKFNRNQKSYPRLIYEALGWTYRGQRYELPVSSTASDRVRVALAQQGWKPGEPTVGINVGAGRAFANKMWPASRIAQVITTLRRQQPTAQVILLGGPDERPTIDQITAHLRDRGVRDGVIDGGTQHDEPGFVALVNLCDALFCGDTMAMHVAIALGKAVVVFFGPTCQQEIDLFSQGQKLVAKVGCGPCYKGVCDHDHACVQAIDANQAVDAIVQELNRVRTRDVALPVMTLRQAG